MMRRAAILVALFVAGLLVWEFVPIQKIVWDGEFQLTVHLTSSDGPLRSVSAEAFGRREEAEETLRFLPPPECRWSSVADPYEGQPLIVHVPLSGRESPFGRELKRMQFRYLVVIGQWSNRKRAGRIVEIPDSRKSREVHVSLP
jgi:hypothetical protein